MKCKISILCFLLLFIHRFLQAQNDQFQFSHLDINNGLSHNQINCILKDSKGFMWFGTLSGLNKYDGYKFKAYKHAVSDTTTLNDDYIVSLAEGPEHNIWVETRNGFNIYNPSTERFSHDIGGYLKNIGLPDARITALKKDDFGNFWFLHATKGIYKYDASSRKVTHLVHNHADDDSIYSNTVSDLSVDSKGNIWLIYSLGVLEKLNPVTYKVNYRSQVMEKLPAGLNTTYRVYIDKQDDLWCFV
ncbi:MAG TPA: two-component regulator propeller domain-containing protein, partial [Mucilaginibacter sp.]|nr:two-component regulator propeller domain-containing protein [Mucilaginibacter sp.]